MFGTAAAVSYLSLMDVDIIRVHDVKEMKQVVMMTKALVSNDLEVA